jgi:hypothetical protein
MRGRICLVVDCPAGFRKRQLRIAIFVASNPVTTDLEAAFIAITIDSNETFHYQNDHV